jgi:hypothetical protein
MAEYDPESEVEGRYPLATVESAGEVSPVFERKANELFTEHLGELDGDRWYLTQDVVNAYEELVNEVGEATMRQGGKESAKAVPWPPEVETPMDGFAALTEMHQEAYRASDMEYPAGRYTFESTGNNSAHVGISTDYPLPVSNAEGVFVGVVQSLSNSQPKIEETQPKDHERAAFEIEW